MKNITQNEFYSRLMLIMSNMRIKSERKFAAELGITAEKLRSYKKGSSPTLEVLCHILLNLPQINTEWLILGNGDMTRKQEENEHIENDLLSFLREENIRLQEKNDKLIEETGRLHQRIEDLESQLSVFLPASNAAEKVTKYKIKHT